MNPLRMNWTTEYQIPPFDQITDAHFEDAVPAALETARKAIADIVASPEPPSFDNTILPLEKLALPLGQVTAPFYALLLSCGTPEREAMAQKFAPMLADFQSEMTSNKALFKRVDAVWDRRAQLELTPEQDRLVDITRRGFVRGGAKLDDAAAPRLGAIMSQLAELGAKFTQNVTAAERDWFMDIPAGIVAGLPEFVQQTSRAAGDALDRGPVVTLSRSLIVPFLQFCSDRALRQRAFEAWGARGEGQGDADNRTIAAQVLQLRYERARLLGFDNFAAYKLDVQMAGDAASVRQLLQDVWRPALSAAQADCARLEAMLIDDGEAGPLQAWDWRYYSERIRRAEHDIDEAQIKPYFQLDRMIEAAFDTAHRLFGLEFTPITIPTWHDDCRAWDVTREGRHLAVFIGDYFARPGKRSGAWCSALRPQHALDQGQRPIVVNNCNFAKSEPALLSYDDAETLFHEFGHALHYILTDVTYPSLSGLNVERDFVELPSQLFEHWLSVPEVLDRFAIHVDTGEPIPSALRDRVLAAATHDAGFATVEYLASAFVDLEFHDGPAPADPMQKQAEILAEIGLPHAIRMRHATPNFSHVFAGDGYSCGYYSYMWSEVMDADAFDAFTEAGDPFDPEVAARLESTILSLGGTRDGSAHYTAFRGRMPGVGPLLRARGLDHG